MNGIAPLKEVKSLCETYVAPLCTVTELDCEGSFCLIYSNAGMNNVDHDGFVGSDYNGGWDE